MITCIAVDDEPLALDLLEDNIRQVPFLRLAARCRSAFEAMEALRTEPVDLVFLDVQMPGLTGLQWLRSLPKPPLAVLITAYERHALESYELDVVDYLLKPVSFERFLKAAQKAQERLSAPTAGIAPGQHGFFFVNAEYGLVRVELADILYVEGLKDYVKLRLAGNPRPVVTRLSLRLLEERLPAADFLRVHKSYIVGLKHLEALRRQSITVAGAEIPVGDSYREQVAARLEKYRLQG